MTNTDLVQAIKNNPKKFMLLESTQIPLVETGIDDLPNKDRVLANMINPITNKPYEDGIILSGVFADLRPQLNNNNRIYSIPEYVELVERLYTQVHSRRGLFGEFEHPEKYNTDGKKVSHKILDIFYDPATQMVYGTVLVLNTPNGNIVKEIIKSGGLICISARAAGSEEKQSDGTLRAITKLLVTYDLVMNPGFSSAELEYIGQPKDFNQLYESIRELGDSRRGFSVMLYETQMEHFNSAYADYLSLNENLNDGCYIQWYAKHKLNESENSDDLTDEEEDSFEEMQIPKEQQQEKKLQKVADAQLKQHFLDESNAILAGYYSKKIRPDSAIYDDSAGFLSSDPDSISVPAGNTFQSFLDICEQESADILNQESKTPKPSKISKPKTSAGKKPKTKGLSGSDYLSNAQSPKVQKPDNSTVDSSEVKKPDIPDADYQKPQKPEKRKFGTKVKQGVKKAKDIGKKNARYYLNLDMDDGNSNAGKSLIEK